VQRNGRDEPRGIWTWPGGSLWLGRVDALNEEHSHYAIQLTVGVDGPSRLKAAGGDWESFDAIAVASTARHAFDSCGRFVAQFMVEPISAHGRALAALLRDRGAVHIDAALAAELRRAVAVLRSQPPGDEGFAGAAIGMLDGVTSSVQSTAPIDRRVQAMCDYIRAHVRDHRVSLEQVAAVAYLSPDRARHLFREHTGLSVKAYVLWARLNKAIHGLPQSEQLTSVAYDSGFADAAHFTRTFRAMYGMTPSKLLRSRAPRRHAETGH
jgi:AraC-like DNA-binding protein